MGQKDQKNQTGGSVPSPLVRMVLGELRSELLSASGPRALASERALGERFGVSRTIVRRALDELVTEGLIEGGNGCRYVVRSQPRTLDGLRRAAHVGIWLWPYLDDFTVSTMLRGIQAASVNTEVRLVIGTISGTTWADIIRAEAAFLHQLIEDPEAVGAIVWLLGGEQSLPALQTARARGLEFVFVDRLPPEGFEADFVGTANVTSAYQATRHLLDMGHRRIVCLTNLDTANTVFDRVKGYEEAMHEAGAVPLISPIESAKVSPQETIQRLMWQVPAPTALFCINDSVALAARDALTGLGTRVPDDISVIGFDGVLRWSPSGGNLTSAYQDFHRIGETAMTRLLSRVGSGNPSATYRHVLLDAPVKPSGSTAPPRQSHVPGVRATPIQESLQ